MYLMARKIKAMGIKMVLSGEGADEVFGGYLYFHKCPNKREFQEETVDKVRLNEEPIMPPFSVTNNLSHAPRPPALPPLHV